jgi:hypothetical protein
MKNSCLELASFRTTKAVFGGIDPILWATIMISCCPVVNSSST